jgi:hypothetical protein
MKNKRKIWFFGIIVLLGFVVMYCDNGTTTPSDNSQADTHTHVWGDWVVATPPSCAIAGTETRTCTMDATHTETRLSAPALGHNWFYDGAAVPPTCTTPGHGLRECLRDGCGTTEDTNYDQLGHDMVDDTVQTASTCITMGIMNTKCDRSGCEHQDIRGIAIDHTAHNSGIWHITVAATCVANGTRELRCTLCQHILETEANSGELPKNQANHAANCDLSIYTIIGGSGQFNTIAGLCTSVGSANQPILTVINTIRDHPDRDKENTVIQFGNGTDVLDIGTDSIGFINTSNIWGSTITLTGKITSTNTGWGTIYLMDGTSIIVTGDNAFIGNHRSPSAGVAISNYGGNTLTINSGQISSSRGSAIISFGILNINGGTVQGGLLYGMTPPTLPSILIDGGSINISGDTTLITASNLSSNSEGTISIKNNATLIMTGGRIQNWSADPEIAIFANTNSSITIIGGTVQVFAGSNNWAIRHTGTGTVNTTGANIIGNRSGNSATWIPPLP